MSPLKGRKAVPSGLSGDEGAMSPLKGRKAVPSGLSGDEGAMSPLKGRKAVQNEPAGTLSPLKAQKATPNGRSGAGALSRILITGSAGFIGSHLVERFLADGHAVVGVDNYLSGQRRNTELFKSHPRFTFLEQDVSKGLEVSGDLDWVLHFASPASPPHYQAHPIETLMVGAQGTQNALELARRKGAKFLLASTSEVYGDPLVHPQPETYWGNVNPNGLRSCYDEAKRYAEALTMAYRRTHGLDTRIVRIFNTYGPRMRPDDGRVVTNFINQALRGEALTVYGDGSQTRSFQYVSDLVEGVVGLMASSWYEPLNLGNPDEYTILSFAKLIRGVINPGLAIVHEPVPADDPRQRRPDISMARAMLGWEPKVPLAQGLAATIRYFQQDSVVSPAPIGLGS